MTKCECGKDGDFGHGGIYRCLGCGSQSVRFTLAIESYVGEGRCSDVIEMMLGFTGTPTKSTTARHRARA